jgi:hypothetical protein
MVVWQADFYRRPLQDEAGNPLWELVVCDPTGTLVARRTCPQVEVGSPWLVQQLQGLTGATTSPPQSIQVFRPQCLSLMQTACDALGIKLEATRQTPALKRLLRELARHYPTQPGYTGQPYEPVKLEQPPPSPVPEPFLGERWRFGSIAAGDLEPAFRDRPIPIRSMPPERLPVNLQLASTTPIPGVIIDGGRQSMRLARWLQKQVPVSLHYISGDPDGLILETGLVDRWVLFTFDDPEVRTAAQTYQVRLQASGGLHFLLIQPDDTGVTYSGLWLLMAASGE